MSDDRTELVRSELLCFLQQKSNVLQFDDLVTIAVDFYTRDEIKEAVSSVHEYVDSRIPSHKGTDKDKKTVSDLLKIVLNPAIKLPSYVAVDIARLPPVDVDHLDLSALLRELTLLRSEVRSIGSLRTELEEVKTTLKAVQAQQAVTVSVGSHTHVADEGDTSAEPNSGQSKTTTGSFAAKAQDLQRSGMKSMKTKQPVFGTSATNRIVKSVDTVRTVDIFVSRLHPLTTTTEMIDCVNSVKGDMTVTDVQCNKLKSKYEDLYASFHIAIVVSSVQFKAAIDMFSSADVWPMGVFVKRFFRPRNGSNNAS